MKNEDGFAQERYNGGVMPLTRSPDWNGTVDELQWMLFRLFGVHSAVFLPGRVEPLIPWGWIRPMICYTLHLIATPDGGRPFHLQCQRRCEPGLAEGPDEIRGRCSAGLTWISLPIRHRRRRAFTVVLGPFRARGDNPERDLARILASPAMPAHINRADLEWPVDAMPRVSGTRIRRIVAWARLAFSAVADANAPRLPPAGWGSLASPLRYSGPSPVSLFYTWVERLEGPPRPAAPDEIRRNGGELYLVEEGAVMVTPRGGGRAVRLGPGQGWLSLAGLDGTFSPAGSSRITGISILFIGEMESFRPLADRPLALSPLQRAAMREMWSAGDTSADETAAAALRAKFLDVLLTLKQSAPHAAGSQPSYQRHHDLFLTTRVKEFLWSRSEGRLSRRELAATFHLTAPHLNQVFHRITGSSLLRYHRALRMARASALLRTTALNVTQVAARLGYASIHHFSAEYKKVHGDSPRLHARKPLS